MLFVPTMSKDHLNLVFFLERDRLAIRARVSFVIIKLFKVLNVVDIVWHFGSSTRNADFITRGTRFLLLLRLCTVVRV